MRGEKQTVGEGLLVWSPIRFLSFVVLLVQENGPSLNFEEARKICLQQLGNFGCVQLVYGHAGWWEALYTTLKSSCKNSAYPHSIVK